MRKNESRRTEELEIWTKEEYEFPKIIIWAVLVVPGLLLVSLAIFLVYGILLKCS